MKVTHCGLCHSDLHLQDGYFDMGSVKQKMPPESLPRVLGHEVGGVVAAVGSDVTGLAVGTPVVAFSWIGCGKGTCFFCANNQEHLCLTGRVLGTTQPGGFGEYIVLPHPRYAIPVRNNLPMEVACPLACSGLTAFSAIKKVLHYFKDGKQNLVIVGLGGVGWSAFNQFKALTGRSACVVDIDPARLEMAKKAGAPVTVNAKDKDAMKKITGVGAAAIDFVGSPESFDLASASVRRGGSIIVVGLFGGEMKMGIPRIPMRAITISGSFVGTVEEMVELMDLASDGKLEPIPVQVRNINEINSTLDELRKGKIFGRVVLRHNN